MSRFTSKEGREVMKVVCEIITAAFALAAIMMILATPIVAYRSYMESKTYNKITGAETTWWDAMWVELRVEGDPK